MTGAADSIMDRVVALWRQGETATTIAPKVKKSRNAVLGYVHRAKERGINVSRVGTKASKPKKPAPPSKPIAAKPATVPSPLPQQPIPPSARELLPQPPAAGGIAYGAAKAVMALTSGSCRWPIGDPGADDFHFCCAPVREANDPQLIAMSRTYCAVHFRRASGRQEQASREFKAEQIGVAQ